MEDREFFDELFQLWSKTTGAEDRYWMPEAHFDNSGRFNVYAVGQGDDGSMLTKADPFHNRKLVASGMSDRDSDFVTAVHGCFADLWRRLHAALDEADTADFERDSRECRIAELESEVSELQKVVDGLSKDPPWKHHDVHE
jgi:hypothetical protein